MARRRSVVSVSLALAVAHSAPAAADDYSLHILANTRLGWTDNLFSATSPESAPAKESDVFVQLIPGLLGTYNTPRAIHELSYSLETNLYVDHDEAWTVTHRGGWRGFFLPSPLSELEASVTVSGGQLNTFNQTQTAADGQVQLVPTAETQFASIDALELYSLQLSRPWRLTQTTIGNLFRTTDPVTDVSQVGYRAGGGFGLDRAWRYNAAGFNVLATYDGLGDTSQTTASGSVNWRRDLGEHWSTLVDGGGVVIRPLRGGGRTIYQPTVGAQMAYYPTWGQAGLGYRRAVAPNLLIAANQISDAVTLNARLPLPWLAVDPNGVPRWAIEASGGYIFASVIEQDTGDDLGGYEVGLVDLAVTYAIRSEVNVALRYQYEHQVADDGVLATINVRDFDRNTVLVTFYGRWPDRLAGEVPARATLRVDRSDLDPLEGEVGTPEGQRPR